MESQKILRLGGVTVINAGRRCEAKKKALCSQGSKSFIGTANYTLALLPARIWRFRQICRAVRLRKPRMPELFCRRL